MKASPNRSILKIFAKAGLHIDASSGHEVHRAMASGIPAEHISLSAQELPSDLSNLLELGVQLNACSLSQLECFGQLKPGAQVGIRINPGAGSGSERNRQARTADLEQHAAPLPCNVRAQPSCSATPDIENRHA